MRRLVPFILLIVPLMLASARPVTAQPLSDQRLFELTRDIVIGTSSEARSALASLRERNRPDVAAHLILALRYTPARREEIETVLRELTGAASVRGWFDWMVWQERNPQIAAHPSFVLLHNDLLRRVDPRFDRFIRPGVAHEIRLEESTWGGVSVDGIPALVDPTMITAAQATWLRPDDLVFGLSFNGDARAYPLRILDWHEMANDTVGGVPVALAYCTLCGAAIAFDRRVEGREQPFEFGSSGLLYRSNKLMYDRQTDSLWNQFTGRPVVGTLTGSGIALTVLPVVTTSWERWRAANPDTKVVSLDTGHVRDYSPGAAYGQYFASPQLMFPARVDDQRLLQKDRVFGIRTVGGAKAWPIAMFEDGRVVNDRAGLVDVVLIGDARTRTVRAYRREGLEFTRLADGSVTADSAVWRVTEDALVSPTGRRLDRMPGHEAFWFAWAGYLGEVAEFDDGRAR